MKSLTFSCLICALNREGPLNLYFAQKLLRKAKFARGCYNRKNLLQTPKVAEHNRERPTTGNPGSVIVPQYGSSKITTFVWGKKAILKLLENTK